jgi:hypothetical protein
MNKKFSYVVMASLLWAGASVASSSEDDAFFDADGGDWQWSADAVSEIESARKGALTPFQRIFPPSLYCQLVAPKEVSEEMVVPAEASPSQERGIKSILRIPSEKSETKKTVSFSLTPTVFLVDYIYTSNDFYSQADEDRNRFLIDLGGLADDEESDSENISSPHPVLSMQIHSITYDWQVEEKPQTITRPSSRRIPPTIPSRASPSIPLLALPKPKIVRTPKEDSWVGSAHLGGQFQETTLQATSSQVLPLHPITEEDEGE